MWQVTVRPTARSLADYLHPIAAFGTQMKSPLQVIFLYGSHTPQQLVDTVTSLNLGTMSIVFIDQPIDAAARRYIGEIFIPRKPGRIPSCWWTRCCFCTLPCTRRRSACRLC